MTIDQAFNDSTPTYDDWMKRALPGYSDLFNTAVQVIPFPAGQAIRVLDLGAGTGSFSQHVLNAYPRAEFVLMDVADRMLEVARQRFEKAAGRFHFRVLDYRDLRGDAEYDLVISSLSIHHLTDEEKQRLFHSIYEILNPVGAFINIDQIRAETETLRLMYWNLWLNHVRSSGAAEEQIQASIKRRKEFDKDAPLADQIAWLKQAGFSPVDIVYRNTFLGVFLALKGETFQSPVYSGSSYS